ncbi:MAG: winged helix-turn-helix transcriptional regulator [Candidatus Bathyarchaeia archaeon]
MHYSEIFDYGLNTPIVESRATVTLSVRNLTAMGLIKRSIVDAKPIRTVYQPTEKGKNLLEYLQAIAQL